MDATKEITIELTNFCPHRCSYCSSSTTDDRAGATYISVALARSLVEGKGYDRINLSGGEPLAHPQFYNILEMCKANAKDVVVYTNALTHVRYNANVIDGIYLEANLTLVPEVDKVHILRRVKQGREANRPEVHLSGNYARECACDHRVVLPVGEVVLTPCNKRKEVKKESSDRRIYVSGAHGVGKTTLIRDASDALGVYRYENDAKNPHLDDVKRRQLWRLYKYKTDEEILNIVEEERVLVNRCWLDWLVYTKVFKKLGWLSPDDFSFLTERYEAMFGSSVPDKIVFLNPPMKWSEDRIRDRWIEGKKWREDDFAYYEALRDAYDDEFSKLSRVTSVAEVDDVNKSVRVEKVRAFLKVGA